MAEMVAGRKGKLITITIISIYLYGTLSIKGVAASLAINNGFAYIFTSDITGFNDYVVNPYFIICTVFFIIVFLLCLKNVQRTKTLQRIIIVCRFVTLSLMIGGAIYIIAKYSKDVPQSPSTFDASKFSLVYGNIIFALLAHHSLPGVFTPLRPASAAKRTMGIANFSATFLLMMIGITASFAFGVYTQDCNDGGFPCAINVMTS